MEYLSTFNFDIVIALVLIASIIAGVYYSFHRQTKKTLILLIPLVALYFVLTPVMDFIVATPSIHTILMKVIAFVAKLFKLGSYTNIMLSGFIAFVLFGLMMLIIAGVFGFFVSSVEKRVLKNIPPFSRVVGGLFGLINGYLISILLLLFMKPIADINYQRPLTNFIVDTSLVYLPVSKLNEVQNANVEIHKQYDEAYGHLSGEKVVFVLLELEDILDTLEAINLYVENTMFAQLGAASQTLINTHLIANDYISALLTDVDGTLVTTTVLTNEKNNAEIATIKEKLNTVTMNSGYWHFFSQVMSEDLGTYDYDEISSLYLDHEEAILGKFTNLRYKNEMMKQMECLAFFATYFNDYQAILNDANVTDFSSYRQSLLSVFQSSFVDYATRFKEYDFLVNHQINQSLTDLFSDYLKHQTNIDLFSPYMSCATKVVLGRRYADWVSLPLWETEVLLHSYLIDTITSASLGGFPLYHEYFFYQYLSEGITFQDQFDVTDFSTMLDHLETQVELGTLSIEQASGFLDGLALFSSSVLYQQAVLDNISPTLYTDIVALNHPYFSDAFITALGNL